MLKRFQLKIYFKVLLIHEGFKQLFFSKYDIKIYFL